MHAQSHFSKEEQFFMEKTIALAKQGNPSPNPYVGCVIVKNGKIIAAGFHNKAGEAHAEIIALQRTTAAETKDATMYLTMEPCTHHGKTPPCIDKVIASGIKEIIIAAADQNPKTHKKGIEALKNAGISVRLGLFEKEVTELNRVFNKFITTKLPYIFLKAAMTQNKVITWGNQQAKQITGEEARRFTHLMRNKCDTILVGINTVLRDDPQLTCRLNIDDKSDPKRIILDSTLKISLNAKVLNDKNVMIITSKKKDPQKYKQLLEKGYEIMLIENDFIDLKEVVKKLGEQNISSILIEGGLQVYKFALQAKIVDEVFFLIAPFVIEDKNAIAMFDDEIVNAIKLENIITTTFGKDVLIAAKVKYK